jgi:sodium transport system permease protein
MSLRNVGLVYRKELLESLRDRRTLMSTILIPLLLFPVLAVGIGYMGAELIGEASRQPSTIMVLGGADSPDVIQGLGKVKNLRILPAVPGYVNLISNKKVRAVVDIPPGFQAAIARGEHPAVKIYIFSGDLKSSFGAARIEKFFAEYRDTTVRRSLTAERLPESLMKPFDIKQENVVSSEKVAAETFGGIIPYLVILMCMTGAMYPAMDLTAGEKERGTMETILSSPISRTHLVLGKFLLVLTASLATAALSVISMGVSFWGLQHGPALEAAQPGDSTFVQLHIGLGAVLAVFLMALPVAVLFSAVLMTIALFAKTYKEAQSYLTPMTFIVIIPAVAAMLPGIELTPKLAIIPILNVSLLCKELVAGTYHWTFIVLIFLSTCFYAAAALFVAVKMFQRESVLFRS